MSQSKALEVSIDHFAYQEEVILRDVNFSLDQGAHLAILGESGGGKSTLLHLIYGLLRNPKGRICWLGAEVLGPESRLIPGAPFMKLVDQEFTLMPMTTVAENIATDLPRFDLKASEQRVDELLEVVGLSGLKHSKARLLSGGQKQRVALAKALATEPEILLLDEPFSQIDLPRRAALRQSLFAHLKQKGITCLTATHDAYEALGYADLIAVLGANTLLRFEVPNSLFSTLDSGYLAGFFGAYSVIPKGVLGDQELFLLPHQLKRTSLKTPLVVTVTYAVFQGTHYLISGHFNGTPIYFNYHKPLKPKRKCYLALLNNIA
ncbi:MAG TPA: ABC transporter ATP-binding protein [Flavobacteriaceae bacterium]|nr:ABC transporter ATP-binding protein [Flavobacteriaceae bacterium]